MMVCVCVCAYVRACMCVCVHACVRQLDVSTVQFSWWIHE